jgi:hypothetical protein
MNPDDTRPESEISDSSSEQSLPHELWLGEMLGKRKELEGSYVALARAITESVPPDERFFSREKRKRSEHGDDAGARVLIDRRRLKAIVEAKPNVELSLRELGYLDRYLSRFGEGLAYRPIFRGSNLLETLARTGNVDFLLGTKPEQERQNISHWDVLGMADIQRGIQSSNQPLRMDIRDVPLSTSHSLTRQSLESEALSFLLREPEHSLVVIGSSRSNPASDAILCRMFGRTPFSSEPADKLGLPFHFVWDESLPYVYKSALHFDLDDVHRVDANSAKMIRALNCAALVVDDTVHIDTLSQRPRDGAAVAPVGGEATFGICAAQRRKSGKLWVVVSGVTGVGTYVAARLVGQLSTGLDEPHDKRNSPVYWGLVRAVVPELAGRPLTSQREFNDPRILWQPEVPAATET